MSFCSGSLLPSFLTISSLLQWLSMCFKLCNLFKCDDLPLLNHLIHTDDNNKYYTAKESTEPWVCVFSSSQARHAYDMRAHMAEDG